MKIAPAFAVLVFSVASCTGTSERSSTVAPQRFSQAPGDTLKEPIVIRSQPIPGKSYGLIDATLDVVLDTTNVAGAGIMTMRSYKLVAANGKQYNAIGFPGPTFRAHPGDSIRILLRNRLPADSNQHRCMDYPASQAGHDSFPNCFHGVNYTNTHYHGFHITPSDSGDNVLIEVAPGAQWQSAFRIPMNQSPGTMWYHPHKHGSVAIQVTNGMSGAFIVDGGGLDSLTQSLHMTEHLIGVQQVDSQVALARGGGSSGTKLVDAQLNPVIVMRPNEVQRWRIVNENVSATTTYSLVFASDTNSHAPTMFDVARDGVQYAPQNYDGVHPDTSLIVAPGNRLDVFTRAPATPGLYKLNAVPTGAVNPRRLLLRGGANAGAAVQQLLTVRVVADTVKVNTTLPSALPQLPAFLANLPATKDTAVALMFSETGGPGDPNNPPSFYLGTAAHPQQKFNPDSAFLNLPLGQTQTWKISNMSTNANHPFHIHINPFQVLKVVYNANDKNAPLYDELNAAAKNGHPMWMDTFALPRGDGTTPGYVVIRQRYDDFTGSFVMHCHILGHEERGMMQLLTVIPQSAAIQAGSHRPH